MLAHPNDKKFCVKRPRPILYFKWLYQHLGWVDIDILSSRLVASGHQGQDRAPNYFSFILSLFMILTWQASQLNAEVCRSLSMTWLLFKSVRIFLIQDNIGSGLGTIPRDVERVYSPWTKVLIH